MSKFYNNAGNVVSAPTPGGDFCQLSGCSLRAFLVLHKCNSMLEQQNGLDQHRAIDTTKGTESEVLSPLILSFDVSETMR